jgi:hypothetical protein
MINRQGMTPFCAHCATGNHRACSRANCTCGARRHDPDVETAAAMRRYQRPDLHRLPVEELATQWRRATGR